MDSVIAGDDEFYGVLLTVELSHPYLPHPAINCEIPDLSAIGVEDVKFVVFAGD
jgi:hypothetical protein